MLAFATGAIAQPPPPELTKTVNDFTGQVDAASTEQMDMLMAYESLSNRSADHAEAVLAIREKRKPRFRGA